MDELDSPSLFCGNPACLGEPWCSAWGICKDVAVEPKNSAATMEEVSGVEQEYTIILLELSHAIFFGQFHPSTTQYQLKYQLHSFSSSSTKSRQFAQIKSDEEVELARTSGIPSKTKQDFITTIINFNLDINTKGQNNIELL